MSYSIFWVPYGEPNQLAVPASSHFVEAMTKVFGHAPWNLNITHSDLLIALAAGFGECSPNPFQNLQRVVNEIGAIQVSYK